MGDSNYNIDFAEFDKFKELEIYTKTYDYFNEALKDVNTKNEKIQNNIVKYYENNQYNELYKYCKDDLKYNRYTFLNMYSDFYERIIPLFKNPIILEKIFKKVTEQKRIDENKLSKVSSVFSNIKKNLVNVFGGKRTKNNKRRTKKHNKRRTKKITKI